MILFSYEFGGAFSVFQGHASRIHDGEGVVVATLSHHAAEFDMKKSPEKKRSITLEYVSASASLLELEGKWEQQEVSPQPIESMFEFVRGVGKQQQLSSSEQKKMYGSGFIIS
jgi:hypothetical protein